MIDYRVHLGALDAFREQLALTDFDDPNVAALRDEHVTDADQQPGAALLGAVIDHLIWHASFDGLELDLLTRAAELWQDGLAVYEATAEFRLQLENALADPSDAGALQALNAASVRIQPRAPGPCRRGFTRTGGSCSPRASRDSIGQGRVGGLPGWVPRAREAGLATGRGPCDRRVHVPTQPMSGSGLALSVAVVGYLVQVVTEAADTARLLPGVDLRPQRFAAHGVVVAGPCEPHRRFPLLLAAGSRFVFLSAALLEECGSSLDLAEDLAELVVQPPPLRVAPTSPPAPVSPVMIGELDHESSGRLVHRLWLDALPVCTASARQPPMAAGCVRPLRAPRTRSTRTRSPRHRL